MLIFSVAPFFKLKVGYHEKGTETDYITEAKRKTYARITSL